MREQKDQTAALMEDSIDGLIFVSYDHYDTYFEIIQ